MVGGDQTKNEDALIGKVIADRYLIESLLGEGGMGAVYRGRHITLDKTVAVKVLHPEYARKDDLVERFLQEARAASKIRNEHVIDITDFGLTDDGVVFFAMEFLSGCDLFSLLSECTKRGELLPWVRSRDIFVQVCTALSAAHAQGIVHRDLKPENVFLVERASKPNTDFVKLFDFGIAKMDRGDDEERKLTKTGMIFGTPEYMAPEQARGEKPDHRVDVYAMGCLLFQFLTGTVPFHADSFMGILSQHMMDPVPQIDPILLRRTSAPTGILAVVQKALCKDRDQRYATIDDLADAVKNADNDGASANRRKRPRTQSDWTGSIRRISTIENDVQLDAAPVAWLPRSWLLAGGSVGALAIAGFLLMRGSSADTAVVTEPLSPDVPVVDIVPVVSGDVVPTSGRAETFDDSKADAAKKKADEAKAVLATKDRAEEAKDQVAKDQAAKDQAAKDQVAKDQAAKAAKDQAAKAAKDDTAKDQSAKDQAAKDAKEKDPEDIELFRDFPTE